MKAYRSLVMCNVIIVIELDIVRSADLCWEFGEKRQSV
jgi:hypothetical protein